MPTARRNGHRSITTTIASIRKTNIVAFVVCVCVVRRWGKSNKWKLLRPAVAFDIKSIFVRFPVLGSHALPIHHRPQTHTHTHTHMYTSRKYISSCCLSLPAILLSPGTHLCAGTIQQFGVVVANAQVDEENGWAARCCVTHTLRYSLSHTCIHSYATFIHKHPPSPFYTAFVHQHKRAFAAPARLIHLAIVI